MPTINYPIPYTIEAKYGRNRNPQPISIADVLEVYFRNVADTEAPVVMSASMTWKTNGLPGQVPNTWESVEPRNDLNPPVQIRHFNDAFYAPVRKFSRLLNAPSEIATPADLESPLDLNKALATPLSKLYVELPQDSRLLLEGQALGRLPTFDDAKIKEITDAFDRRGNAVTAAMETIGEYACIDGRLWKKLAGEPRLRFQEGIRIVERDGEDAAERMMVVDIVDDDTIKTHRIEGGFFRLDRLDDCIEHIRSNFPTRPILVHFDDLRVEMPEALALNEERGALLSTARNILQMLPRMEFYLSPALIDLSNRLQWEIGKTKEGGDLGPVIGILEQMPPLMTNHPREAQAITAALDRWQLRPVTDFAPAA